MAGEALEHPALVHLTEADFCEVKQCQSPYWEQSIPASILLLHVGLDARVPDARVPVC